MCSARVTWCASGQQLALLGGLRHHHHRHDVGGVAVAFILPAFTLGEVEPGAPGDDVLGLAVAPHRDRVGVGLDGGRDRALAGGNDLAGYMGDVVGG